MEGDGGLLHFELLLRHAEIDLALFTFDLAYDFLLGNLQAGALDRELSVGKIALILLGGDTGLRNGLIEGGLGLAEGRFLLKELLLGAGGIEA